VPWWSQYDPTPREGVKSALVGMGFTTPRVSCFSIRASGADGISLPPGFLLPVKEQVACMETLMFEVLHYHFNTSTTPRTIISFNFS